MQLDAAGMDTDQSPLLFLSENTWRVLIAVSTAVVLLLTVYSLSRGITIIFMHLYYFPIVLLAYRYRKTGFFLSVLLSLAYLSFVFYYSPWQLDIIEGAISRAVVFIGVAALIAYISERLVKNQETLQKVSQIQQSSLINANVWLMLLDARGRILVWNKAAERISGYPAEEVLGSGAIWKLLYPERNYRDMITGKIARIIAENNFFENLETTIRTKAGEHRTISWNTRGLPKKEGEEDRYIAIGIDITERLNAEEKYRSLFKNVVIGVFQTTPDGRVLSMNPALARMYGYETPEEMIRTVTDIQHQLYMHPQDRDTFKYLLSTDAEVRNFITENRHRDGHPIWISINAKEVKDVSGAVLYYEGTIEDITARILAERALKKKHEDLEAAYEEITATEEELRANYEDLSQKEAKLKESEQYYRTVFENTGTAMVVVEENNIISLANDEFANLAGFSK
jgi:PAS domain S-box-containing protein